MKNEDKRLSELNVNQKINLKSNFLKDNDYMEHRAEAPYNIQAFKVINDFGFKHSEIYSQPYDNRIDGTTYRRKRISFEFRK